MLQKLKYIEELSEANIIVVTRETPERTLEIAKASYAGGIKAIEISFTKPSAIEAIKLVKKFIPEMQICAGTVLDETTARIAILNGVHLILSPAFDKEVAKLCNLYQVPYSAGCNSMTEIIDALKSGSDFIKTYPGSSLNGVDSIKKIKEPIPNVPLLVSGGATLENYSEFLQNGADVVCFGSVLNGKFEEIVENGIKLNKILSEFRS